MRITVIPLAVAAGLALAACSPETPVSEPLSPPSGETVTLAPQTPQSPAAASRKAAGFADIPSTVPPSTSTSKTRWSGVAVGGRFCPAAAAGLLAENEDGLLYRCVAMEPDENGAIRHQWREAPMADASATG